MADETEDEVLSEPLAAVRDALTEPRTLTLREVSAAAGVPFETLADLFDVANRLRDAYGDQDLRYARLIAQLLELIPPGVLRRAMRVRGRHVSSLVINDLSVVRDAIIRPMLDHDITVDEIADQLAHASGELIPTIAELLSLDYRDTLLRFLELEVVAEASRTGAAELRLAVGFVDLVGFTKLSAQADPEGVGEVLTAFEDLVHEVVDASAHVLIAKFIGDAAMLVCEDTEDLARCLYEVVSDGRPHIEQIGRRAGVACGTVLTREGDYYGATVNMAARLTDLARPHSLVAAPDVAAELTASQHWELSRIGSVEIRGAGKVRPVRLRWHGPQLTEAPTS